jgi:antitoxin (DNA-binding transcriptional repressor) of toxin-antitoxin stability system
VATQFEISIPNVEDFFEDLIAQAEAGETIILTRDGQPVACIPPVSAQKPAVYPDRGFGISNDPAFEA